VAQATFHVVPPPPDDEEGTIKITYSVDTQRQRLPSRLPIRKAWLDAAVRRKRMVGASSQMFAQTGRLPTPQAFVPGMYKAQAAIAEEAIDGLEANAERLQQAMDDLADSEDVELRNMLETDDELEQLLISIFNDADKDGNGYLDRNEFSQLLDTAELGLEHSEKIALLSMADCNGDGHIEYKEFVPLGADIIQTMRIRKAANAENAAMEELAEMQARETIHGLGEANVTALLLDAFKTFDTDGSGSLERDEMVKCLESLHLGSTRLTAREINYIMALLDEDCSGAIEYNEFAPLMFNWMIEALKLGFTSREMSQLEAYMQAHLASYEPAAIEAGHAPGTLPRRDLKTAIQQMDLIVLTPVQVHTLLADCADVVDIEAWLKTAAPLAQRMMDPALVQKRKAVTVRAQLPPVAVLTAEERERLAQMAQAVFVKYDEDGSGQLDRVEFHKCLTESKLGFSDRHIQQLMMAADYTEDGMIDYGEFADLFENYLCEVARQEAIERALSDADGAGGSAALADELVRFLDELMIPLHIAFDITSEGTESVPPAAIGEMLRTKAAEWSVSADATDRVIAAVDALGVESVPWPQLVDTIEELAMSLQEGM